MLHVPHREGCPCCSLHRLTLDRRPDTKKEKLAFSRARAGEAQYARALRDLARKIGSVVRAVSPAPGDSAAVALLEEMLRKYAKHVEPWARRTAQRMLADVSRRDEAVWHSIGLTMGRHMRREIEGAHTSEFLRTKLAENVKLITSLPTEAAERVHALALGNLSHGRRADEIADEILRTSDVTVGRAMTIARTEVARAASGLVEVRAKFIGSEGYIWRTAEDEDVRNKPDKRGYANPVGSHRLLNGHFIRWDSPPVASTNGARAHAGQIYNCRCYPEPQIPEHF